MALHEARNDRKGSRRSPQRENQRCETQALEEYRGGGNASRRELSSHYREHSGKPLGLYTGGKFVRRNSRSPCRDGRPPTQTTACTPCRTPRCRVVRQSITSLGSRPCGTSPTLCSVRSGSRRHAAPVFMHQGEMDRWCGTPGALIYARPPRALVGPPCIHGRESMRSPAGLGA